jgi:peptidylprolyl isomerase
MQLLSFITHLSNCFCFCFIPPYYNRTLPEITNRVFLEIEIEGKSIGKISFGLFGKNAPEAAENFLGLSKCDKGKGKYTNQPLCFKGTKFHRIVSYFGLQGGDITHHDGTGGESIYGGTFQSNMRELTKFNRPYMLAVAANDPSKATSQFFVTTVKAQWLTGKHAIFGMVVDGWDVIDEIEKYGTYGGNPRANVTIVDCGEEPLKEKDKEPHY